MHWGNIRSLEYARDGGNVVCAKNYCHSYTLVATHGRGSLACTRGDRFAPSESLKAIGPQEWVQANGGPERAFPRLWVCGRTVRPIDHNGKVPDTRGDRKQATPHILHWGCTCDGGACTALACRQCGPRACTYQTDTPVPNVPKQEFWRAAHPLCGAQVLHTMSRDITVGQMVAQCATRGASPDFLAVLATEASDNHLARSKVKRALARGDSPTPDGFGAGGWYTSLWEGDTTRAHARADLANRRIMEKAGVKPVTSGASAPARQD